MNYRMYLYMRGETGIARVGTMQSLGRSVAHSTADPDNCELEELEDYNQGLHIGAIFIILAASILGAFAPVVLRHLPWRPVQVTLKLGTFFAFGTIISTGFIHMLQPAAESLSSPCLPESFTSYEAWAYVFALIAIVLMQLIDFLISSTFQGEGLSHSHQPGGLDPALDGLPPGKLAPLTPTPGSACGSDEDLKEKHAHGHAHAHAQGPVPAQHCHEPCHQHCHEHGPGRTLTPEACEEGRGGAEQTPADCAHGTDRLGAKLVEAADDVHAAACHPVAVYLLEAGIVFHSVIIGLTLGVTSGSAFNTLLIALCFHQFFEGFALGFAAVSSQLATLKMAAIGAVYALSTPIGIGIGIGVRSSYNQNAQSTLYVQGIFDSFSAGILIYVGLVQLLNAHMTQNVWFRRQAWPVKVLGFCAFYGGITVMAIIGKYA
ncbi:ZIP Zinc transporter [Helicosporidium sp. ATCC 50920]|nr:ZIP Zinc transporter [Helicosporidium sp. ATCC 50920]|eukprot:KDD74441.1 ZIP Zinc transporter [Helicosporidium sp. ATCC 50920]